MSLIFSKLLNLPTTHTSCYTYVHPWTESCSIAIAGCFLYCIFDSLRIYGTVYLLTLLMKGKIPTKKDIQRTLYGVMQSTAFLSFTGFGYSLFLCTLRKLMGNFNLLTVSAIPAFLSSVFAILIERPSRRTLLCLYVSNVATETVWNMALSRNLVRNIRYGDVALFGASMALLLKYYKSGYHKDVPDSMFKVLRFVIGPYEEKDYGARISYEANTFYRQQISAVSTASSESLPINEAITRRSSQNRQKFSVLCLINQMLKTYKKLIQKIKCSSRHRSCPHPFSCYYYVIGGTSKMFSVGLGIQIILKLVFNLKQLIASPKNAQHIFLQKNILNLGLFLGVYAGLFRGSLCILRRIFRKDNPNYAIPAGLLASIAFIKYPDTTVTLYVMWKAAQITYNLGIEKGYVPKIPGFTEFLYCLSTGLLFHAAIIEPTNLRPSYWKFLHSISGGRIACMAREPLDVWGYNTTESLKKVLKATKTIPVVYF